MTSLASLDATYEITDDDVGQLLRDVETATQRETAQVALLLISGSPAREIRADLGLSAQRYSELTGRLRGMFRPALI